MNQTLITEIDEESSERDRRDAREAAQAVLDQYENALVALRKQLEDMTYDRDELLAQLEDAQGRIEELEAELKR